MSASWSKMTMVAGAAVLMSALAVQAKEVPTLDVVGEIKAGAQAICGGDKNFVYAANGTEVTKYDSKGEKSKSWPLPSTISGVEGVAVDETGVIFVGGKIEGGLGVIRLADTETKAVEASWKLEGAQGLTGMKARKGNVYVADSKGRCIRVLDTKTGKIKFIGADKNGRTNGMLATCCGILDFDINKKGQLVIANLGQFRVTTCSATGTGPSAWGEGGTKRPEQFCGCCNPVSVAVMPDESIVTAEKTIPRVKVYAPGGRKLLAMTSEDSMPKGCGALPVVTDAEGDIYMLFSGTVKVFRLPDSAKKK